jgi:RNA polymerase sigma-70 factor (sigma-E family)
VGVEAQRNFDEFFAESWHRVLRATFGVTRDAQRAEDAAQSAFAKAYASWSRVSRAEDPLAYVRRMAFNEVLSQGRLAFRHREIPAAVVPDRQVDGADAAAGLRLDVWNAIGSLPMRQRAVVVLRYYDDLSEMQIADVLGVRPGTVKSQASAALTKLRSLLDDQAIADMEGGVDEPRC